MRFAIESYWDGQPAPASEHCEIQLTVGLEQIELRVDAPLFGDPSPKEEPGRVDGLWEYEVVELFLLGSEKRYLEIELGPFGHYLVLQLAGERVVVEDRLDIHYEVRRHEGRWTGLARLPRELAPAELLRANAYAIRGQGDQRRYLAWRPVPGEAPDFHRLECFGVLPPPSA